MAGNALQASRASDARRRLSARLSRIPEILWVPGVSAGLILMIGLFGLLFKQPWLFASLGPTAYLIAHSPDQPSSRFHNVLGGHLIGLAAAFLVLAVMGAGEAPSVFVTHQLVGARVLASAVAIGLATAAELLVGASHPPAAATVLLITLGGFPMSFQSALTIIAGVLLVSLFGEPLRRVRSKR